MPSSRELGPLVVDANVLFSALLKDGTTRLLILHPKFDLHTPAYLWDELERNRDYLVRKSGATEQIVDVLVRLLQQRIRSIPLEVIRPQMPEATRRLASTTNPDAPYVAAALAIDGTLWTHDKSLTSRAKVPTITTGQMLSKLYE